MGCADCGYECALPLEVSCMKRSETDRKQVYYPFEKFGYGDVNFIIDPVDYYM